MSVVGILCMGGNTCDIVIVGMVDNCAIIEFDMFENERFNVESIG